MLNVEIKKIILNNISKEKKKESSFIDYTFSSYKKTLFNELEQINEIEKQKKTKNFIYDLKKTFKINYDLLNLMTDNNQELNNLVKKIDNSLKQKEEILKRKQKIKGKILIEKQIQEEFKKKIEENNFFFDDQIKSSEDKGNIKIEYIAILLGKLKEIDIFTGRNSKIVGSGFEKYKNFRISDFIDKNTNLYHLKGNYFMEIHDLLKNIEQVRQENIFYKFEQKNVLNKKYNNDKNDINYKTKLFIDNYKRNCRVISIRIKLLTNCLKKMTKTIQFLNVPEKLKNNLSKKENEEKKNTTRFLFSKDNFYEVSSAQDITKKIESFMDFSIYLNRNMTKVNNSTTKTSFMKSITYNWNVSKIEKID